MPSPYGPSRPITLMSTGYWWNGHSYHETEREAKIHAWLLDHSVFHSIRRGDRDSQLQRDAVWQAVAAVTVVPVAAVPLLFGAGAITAAATTQSMLWVVLLAVASVVCAPVAWRILSPIASRYLAPEEPSITAEEEVARLSSIRADLTRTQAAELERIERSLHDGAQARMVALGMRMSAAERLVDSDPEQVKQILREAQASSVVALNELRTLVRGINPPVLVERGLVDAIRALALDAPVQLDVRGSVPGRGEQPVEAALYYAVAELIANVAKHSHATHAVIELSHADDVVRVVVSDDGAGGAAATPGSGLDGIARRLAAFDGRLDIDSPAGGPTRVTVAVPCELS
ncbi:MAG: sensor histidine kinase [Solirubrobacteraceae bacterium]